MTEELCLRRERLSDLFKAEHTIEVDEIALEIRPLMHELNNIRNDFFEFLKFRQKVTNMGVCP